MRALHERDLARGYGEVFLPDALVRKWPTAPKEWIWQYKFPSGRPSVDPRIGKTRRHHMHENGLQKAEKAAAQQAGITKKVNCHSLRHSFAAHLLESGYDIRTVQELLGHADVSTTMIDTRVLHRGGKGVRSPLDGLLSVRLPVAGAVGPGCDGAGGAPSGRRQVLRGAAALVPPKGPVPRPARDPGNGPVG